MWASELPARLSASHGASNFGAHVHLLGNGTGAGRNARAIGRSLRLGEPAVAVGGPLPLAQQLVHRLGDGRAVTLAVGELWTCVTPLVVLRHIL